MPKLLVIFGEILWHTHGYFEQQSKVLEFAIIIVIIAGINVYYVL
jgi:hypothetical protein